MPIARNQSQTPSKPFYEALGGDVRLYLGDVRTVLRGLPAQCVHSCITSPPYWGLRDYKTGSSLELGSEKTPEEFVANLVAVFREIHRVLRDDGTVWLNLGDTYSAGKRGGNQKTEQEHLKNVARANDKGYTVGGWGKSSEEGQGIAGRNTIGCDLTAGNLVGIPWRVALALQADGWILRQDVIWHKPSPMPESVSDRCTKAHEYIFLLCKQKPYYYDAVAIREEGEGYGRGTGPAAFRSKRYINNNAHDNQAVPEEASGSHAHSYEGGRNKRSVWTVTSQGYEGSHFATFPPKLIEPCILAGVPEFVCVECGAPRERIVEKQQLTRERPNDYVKRVPLNDEEERQRKAEILSRTKLNNVPGRSPISTKSTLGPLMNTCSNSVAGVSVKTTGWAATCGCLDDETAGTVLDPFVGSATTCVVALQHGRKSIGIDLSEKYLINNAIPRIEGACHDIPALAARIGTRKPLVGKSLLK